MRKDTKTIYCIIQLLLGIEENLRNKLDFIRFVVATTMSTLRFKMSTYTFSLFQLFDLGEYIDLD